MAKSHGSPPTEIAQRQYTMKDSVLGTLWLKKDPGWGDHGKMGKQKQTTKSKHRAGLINVPKDMKDAHKGYIDVLFCRKML